MERLRLLLRLAAPITPLSPVGIRNGEMGSTRFPSDPGPGLGVVDAVRERRPRGVAVREEYGDVEAGNGVEAGAGIKCTNDGGIHSGSPLPVEVSSMDGLGRRGGGGGGSSKGERGREVV